MRAIRAPPPWPNARAPAPASRRRCFSVRCGATSSYSPASTASTSTPRRYRSSRPPRQLSDKLVVRGPLTARMRLILTSTLPLDSVEALQTVQARGGADQPFVHTPTPTATSMDGGHDAWLRCELVGRPRASRLVTMASLR